MFNTQIIKVNNNGTEMIAVAKDTFEGWKETFEFLKSEGIAIEAKSFSDYSGPTITSDQIFGYSFDPSDCPALVDAPYMF